jgi:hypothetical protein
VPLIWKFWVFNVNLVFMFRKFITYVTVFVPSLKMLRVRVKLCLSTS